MQVIRLSEKIQLCDHPKLIISDNPGYNVLHSDTFITLLQDNQHIHFIIYNLSYFSQEHTNYGFEFKRVW